MAFREPTKGAKKRKGRQKHLTIYNTDKYYNLAQTSAQEVKDRIPVNMLTKAEIDTYMATTSPADIIMDNKRYIYDQGSLLDENYVITMIKKGMDVYYHTRDPRKGHAGTVPDAILEAFATSNKGAVVFGMEAEPHRDYTVSVEKAHEATKVIIDCPVVLPDVEANKVVMALAPLSTNVDEVQVDMMPLHESEISDFRKAYYFYSIAEDWYTPYPKSKFDWFKRIKNPLSGWGMIINMLYWNEADKTAMADLVKKDKS